MSCLGQPTALVAIERNPHVERVVQALGASPEVQAPHLIFPRNLAQRLERDRDLNRVTILSDHPFRLHQQIETEVLAHSFSPDAIGLHAEWVEVKFVSAPLIVKGVKEHADVIVAPDLVSLGNRCAHFARIIETMKGDVEEVCIVAESNLGAILWDE